MKKKSTKKKIGVKEQKTSGSGKATNLKSWKKGQSGNPKGRPKKADCLTSLLKEEIEKIDPDDKENRTHKEMIIVATMRLAKEGNSTALKEVWERMDGKVKDKLEVDNKRDSKEAVLLSKVFTIEELKEMKRRCDEYEQKVEQSNEEKR